MTIQSLFMSIYAGIDANQFFIHPGDNRHSVSQLVEFCFNTPQSIFSHDLLFQRSKSTLIFSLMVSMSECIFARTITKVINPRAIGQTVFTNSNADIAHISPLAHEYYSTGFDKSSLSAAT
jgi:hypothetical protein